ncbi:hypothetical protein ABEW34_17290 [Paenibacillus algorifonticola]|uniref:hypothetical protein n=1 Tax=Paenibacillus algorifonticola TaxID=684063 RepID=UPI003D2A88AD
MKKKVSLVLVLILSLSLFGIFSVSAESTDLIAGKIPDVYPTQYSAEELAAITDNASNTTLFGKTLAYDEFIWEFDVPKDVAGFSYNGSDSPRVDLLDADDNVLHTFPRLRFDTNPVQPIVGVKKVKVSQVNMYVGIVKLSILGTDSQVTVPTPEPTQSPSPEPTQDPTPVPTQSPSPEPTQNPSPEPTQSPDPSENENAILTITLDNGFEKEYDLTATELNAFLNWYDAKAGGTGSAKYGFEKNWNNGPFTTQTEYIIFDKILTFEVSKYTLK